MDEVVALVIAFVELCVVLGLLLAPIVAWVAARPAREAYRRRHDPRRAPLRPRDPDVWPRGGTQPRLRDVGRAGRAYRRAGRWF